MSTEVTLAPVAPAFPLEFLNLTAFRLCALGSLSFDVNSLLVGPKLLRVYIC